jgi:hypothetical protein
MICLALVFCAMAFPAPVPAKTKPGHSYAIPIRIWRAPAYALAGWHIEWRPPCTKRNGDNWQRDADWWQWQHYVMAENKDGWAELDRAAEHFFRDQT